MSAKIPILDCSPISDSFDVVKERAEFQDFSTRFYNALKENGGAYLVNTGLDWGQVETLFATTKKFFDLPKNVKMKYSKDDVSASFHGYSAPEHEQLHHEQHPEAEDAYELFEAHGVDGRDEDKYPEEVPGLKSAFDSIQHPFLLQLNKKLLFALAVGLKVENPEKCTLLTENRHLDDPTIVSENTFRAYHYLPLDASVEYHENWARMSQHHCWGTFWYNIRDGVIGGFQIKDRQGGGWLDVGQVEKAVLVLPGLMIENWTSGHIPATLTRIRIVEETMHKDGRSLDFYGQPDGDALCAPIKLGIDDADKDSTWVEKKDAGDTHSEFFKKNCQLFTTSKK